MSQAFSVPKIGSEKHKTDRSKRQLDSDGKERAKEAQVQDKQENGDNRLVRYNAETDQEIPLPFTLFAYGAVADLFFLVYKIKMSRKSELIPSSISGYRMKFFGVYPAPIPARGKTISEFSIAIKDQTELRNMTEWFGAAYKLVDCKIEVMRNEGQDYAPSAKNWVPPRWVRDRVVDGKVFVWAGDVESEGLREGYWDQSLWEMERDVIMKINKRTNTRVLHDWEVKQRSRFDMWENERKEEEQKRRRGEEAKMKKKLGPRMEERRERELGDLE